MDEIQNAITKFENLSIDSLLMLQRAACDEKTKELLQKHINLRQILKLKREMLYQLTQEKSLLIQEVQNKCQYIDLNCKTLQFFQTKQLRKQRSRRPRLNKTFDQQQTPNNSQIQKRSTPARINSPSPYNGVYILSEANSIKDLGVQAKKLQFLSQSTDNWIASLRSYTGSPQFPKTKGRKKK